MSDPVSGMKLWEAELLKARKMPIDGDDIEKEFNGRRRRVTRETGYTRRSFHFAALVG
jgi:hypothetical protein